MEKQKVRLTQTVQKGGCAAKVAASELRKILDQVKFPPKPAALMVDGGLFDDAAIFKVNSEVALVQTLDFFTPIVDTPKLFGQIAAANALSDVYAMGGRPQTAMAILAFPLATMDYDVIVEVLQGGSDKIAEAKAGFVGGHSIDDDTLKFGLSVTGYVHPEKIWSNQGAKAGDHLILTKPLGTGTNTATIKREAASEDDIMEVLLSMAQLNNAIDVLSNDELLAIHSATDITGFGLSGHSYQMAKASGVSFRIQSSALPVFSRTFEFLEKGFLTKAHRTNREYTEAYCDFSNLSELEKLLIMDPQTSGGLLLSVDSTKSSRVLSSLHKLFPKAQIIGEVIPQSEKLLYYHF